MGAFEDPGDFLYGSCSSVLFLSIPVNFGSLEAMFGLRVLNARNEGGRRFGPSDSCTRHQLSGGFPLR